MKIKTEVDPAYTVRDIHKAAEILGLYLVATDSEYSPGSDSRHFAVLQTGGDVGDALDLLARYARQRLDQFDSQIDWSRLDNLSSHITYRGMYLLGNALEEAADDIEERAKELQRWSERVEEDSRIEAPDRPGAENAEEAVMFALHDMADEVARMEDRLDRFAKAAPHRARDLEAIAGQLDKALGAIATTVGQWEEE